MATINFHGKEIEYNGKALKSWKLQRKLVGLDQNEGIFIAADAVLNGKADEVAELLDDDIDAMGELLQAIVAEIGGEVKN